MDPEAASRAAGGSDWYTRFPDKESRLDTVWYEIDHLRFALAQLQRNGQMPVKVKNLLIEGFLVHYRALIQFFSDPKAAGNRKNDNLLTIQEPAGWIPQGRTPTSLESDELQRLQEEGRKCWQKSWGAQAHQIGIFLAHITEERDEYKVRWNFDELISDLSPILERFEAMFRNHDDTSSYDALMTATLEVDLANVSTASLHGGLGHP